MRNFKTAISAICLFGTLLISSCTDEPKVADKFEPVKDGRAVQGKVDFSILSRYEAALEDATYTCNDVELYENDLLTTGRWELVKEDLVGFEPILPSSIVVRDGKIWKPVSRFSLLSGPTAFGTAIEAVNAKLGKEYYAYACRPFIIDADHYTLTLDSSEFGIALADDENMVLSYESDYVGGRTDNGGRHLQFGFYTKTEPLSFTDGKDLGFDSVVEAYDWLIDLFRTTFGDEVNLNTLYGPNIILDQPYFNISRLEAEREWYIEN